MEYVTDSAISADGVFDKMSKADSGSVICHYGIVRKVTGDKVTARIHFEASGDVESELRTIADDIRGKWDIEDVMLVRRIGTLGIGDIISLVAVSAARSKDSFAACEYGMLSLKKMSTIKKNEVFEK